MVDTYPLGAVPSLSVFKGETLKVTIESKLGPGATYSLSFEGAAPKGALSLNASTGMLTYSPAPQDRTRIKPVVQATKDGRSEKQTVVIMTEQPSDFSLIEHRSPESASPDPSAWQYVTFVEEAAQAEKIVFNNEVEYQDADQKRVAVQTRQVTASGVRLVLDRSEKYPLFARLDGSKSFDGRTDLKRVTLCADEVVVRSRLELPGTDVSIYARRLIFEKDGQIVTTPRSVTLQATNRMEGLKGQDAGSIHLYVQQLEMPGETVRLITTGGHGQAAKAGVRGADGGTLTPWDGHSETPVHFGFSKTHGLNWPKEHEEYKPVYVEVGYFRQHESKARVKTRIWNLKDGPFGAKKWPTEGEDPKAKPGAPGHGGNGGFIHSPFAQQLEKRSERKAGDPGKKADDIPAAKMGEPQKACWVYAKFEEVGWFENRLDGYEVIEKHDARKTNGATAPGPDPKQSPKSGELKPLDRTGAGYWLHPTAVRALVSYSHDSMLAGRPEDARRRLAQYDLALTEARKSGGVLTDADASSIEWPALHAEVSALIQRIDSPNDYFGNPPGWVPMLSFEANLKLYEGQIAEAISTMYVAYWIGKNQQKNQQARKTLETARACLAKEAEQAQKDSQDGLKRLAELEKKCVDIKKRIEDLQKDRDTRMEALKKDAENALRWEGVLRSAGEMLGALMQLAPIGQPALGAFGKGLTVLSELDPDNPGKTISGVAGAFSDLAKEKLTEKFKPMFEGISEAQTEQDDDEKKTEKKEEDPEKAKEKATIKKKVAKKKLAEKVSKILDDEKEAKEHLLNGFSKKSASEDDLKERLQKLEAECPEYQALIKDIEKLNLEKAGFVTDLMATVQLLDDAATVLLTSQMARIELRSELDSTLDRINPDALQYIQAMGQRARQRLIKYQYYLLKSYQYLMFEDFAEIDFGARKIIDQFAEILGAEGTLSKDDYSNLRRIFDEQLQDIIERIIDGYQQKGFGRESDFQVQLTPGQLQVLNQSRELALDPMQMAVLDRERDRMRLIKIETKSVKVSGLPKDKKVSFKLTYEHDGVSKLRAGGRLYLFCSGVSSKTGVRQPMYWETGIDHDPDAKEGERLTKKESRVDQAAASLLEYLIGRVTKNDEDKKSTETLLTYRPSPWAKITIGCEKTTFNYNIEELALKFFYVADLADTKFATVLVRMGRGVDRMIYLDTYDENHRSDGVGTFLRTFRRGAKITLEAPDEDFEGWQVGAGPKRKGPLQLTLDDKSYIVKATFKKKTSMPRAATLSRVQEEDDWTQPI